MVATATARAMVLEAPRRLVARDVPRPEIGEDDGLLRVEACGLCGTDHEQYTGSSTPAGRSCPATRPSASSRRSASAPPSAGACGGRPRGRRGVPVVPRPARPASGATTATANGTAWPPCTGSRASTSAPGSGAATPPTSTSDPTRMLLPVPEGLDPVLATVFNPLGAGIRWGVTVPGTKPGDVVAVLGPGIRGLSVAAAAKHAGAAFVMVTGAGERDHPRLEAARRFGADLVVDVTRGRSGARAAPARARWAGRRRRRRDRQGPRRARAGGGAGPSRGHGRRGRHARRAPRRPASTPTTSCTRSSASSARSASTPRRTARRSTCSAAGTFPFADLPRARSASMTSSPCCKRWRARAIPRPSTASSVPELTLLSTS